MDARAGIATFQGAAHKALEPLLEIANGGVPGGGFSAIVGELGSLCKDICYYKGTLLAIDTSLALAVGFEGKSTIARTPF